MQTGKRLNTVQLEWNPSQKTTRYVFTFVNRLVKTFRTCPSARRTPMGHLPMSRA